MPRSQSLADLAGHLVENVSRAASGALKISTTLFGVDGGTTRLGIDFGTSTTVAVIAVGDREPRPLLFDGSPLLPSAVCVDPTGRMVVGRDALHTAVASPESFEPNPKRCIDDGVVFLGGCEVPVPELLEAVLRRVLDEAANVTGNAAGTSPDMIVITCPAAWGAERRATLAHAAPPGAELISEPVAAAHYFVDIAGHRIVEGRTAVIYDFGAGTFDASVVRHTGHGFEVLANRGLPDSGGLDIDAAVVAHLRAALPDEALWQRLEQPDTAVDRRARHQLWDNVRTAKEMLSRTTTTLIHVPLLERDLPLGREELDRLATPVLERTVAATRDVLMLAGVAPTDVDTIFLCGGSSRMPAVVTVLHRAFGVAPITVEQPELAVAEGSLRTGATAPVDPDWPAVTPLDGTGRGRPARRRPVRLAAVAGVVTALVVGAMAITAWAVGVSDDTPRKQGTAGAHPSMSSAPASSPSPSLPPGSIHA